MRATEASDDAFKKKTWEDWSSSAFRILQVFLNFKMVSPDGNFVPGHGFHIHDVWGKFEEIIKRRYELAGLEWDEDARADSDRLLRSLSGMLSQLRGADLLIETGKKPSGGKTGDTATTYLFRTDGAWEDNRPRATTALMTIYLEAQWGSGLSWEEAFENATQAEMNERAPLRKVFRNTARRLLGRTDFEKED